MRSHRPGARWLPGWSAAMSFLLVGILAACTRQPVASEKETAIAQLLTIQPETALTLTAWPSPPPILTHPPAATVTPRPLWTAAPAPDVPVSNTPTGTAAIAETAIPSETVAWAAAPVGSNPSPIRLVIPALALDVPVVEVGWDIVEEAGTWKSVWQTAVNAAGHHRDSANPGEAGNVVLSGHHNTKGEVFRQLSEIGQPGAAFGQGDEIVLEAQDGRQYTYTVVQWERLPETGVSAAEWQSYTHYLDPTSEAILTLVTCWPYESNTHRVIVVAELQPSE